MRDLIHSINAVPVIVPAVQTIAANSGPIDLKGANRGCFVVSTGAVAGSGNFGVKLQESDTTTPGDFADVVAAEVDTSAPATLAAESTYKLGYRGYKRYVRLALTKAGGTSIALGAVAVLTDLASRPAA